MDARAAGDVSSFQPIVLVIDSRRVHRDALRLAHALGELAPGRLQAVDPPSLMLGLPAHLAFRVRDHP